MPEAVVDILETIEIKEEDGAVPPIAPGARTGLAEAIEKERPVWQAGQRIMERLMCQPRFQRPPLGHVKTGAEPLDRPPGLIPDDLRQLMNHADLTSRSHDPEVEIEGRGLLKRVLECLPDHLLVVRMDERHEALHGRHE